MARAVHATVFSALCCAAVAILLRAVDADKRLSGCDTSFADDLTNRVTKKSRLQFIEDLVQKSEAMTGGDCADLHFTNFDINLDMFKEHADLAVRTSHVLSDILNSKTAEFLRVNGWPTNVTNLLRATCTGGANPFFRGDPIQGSLTLGTLASSTTIFAAGACLGENVRSGLSYCSYRFRRSGGSYHFGLSEGDAPVVELPWFVKPREVVRELDRMLAENGSLPTAAVPVAGSPARRGTGDSRRPHFGYSRRLWTDPYFDCELGHIWMITYASPLVYVHDGGRLEYAGMTGVDINLSDIDIDECGGGGDNDVDDEDDVIGDDVVAASPLDAFRNTHLCEPTSTACRPLAQCGFRFGSYRCHCRRGFYRRQSGDIAALPRGLQYYEGAAVLNATLAVRASSACNCSNAPACRADTARVRAVLERRFACARCPRGCDVCETGLEVCVLRDNAALVATLTALNLLSVLVCVVLIAVVTRHRQRRVFRAASWPFLIAILVGAATALIGNSLDALAGGLASLEPSDVTCVLAPWLYYVGFALSYGGVLVKTWRLSQIFSRQRRFRRDADRKRRLGDTALARYLAAIVASFVALLAVWTTALPSAVEAGRKSSGALLYRQCSSSAVDSAMLAVTLLLLAPAVYLGFQLRNVADEFSESRQVCVSVYAFVVVQAIFLAARRSFRALTPDVQFVLRWLDVNASFSLLVAVLFAPKLVKLLRGGGGAGNETRPGLGFRRKRATASGDGATVFPGPAASTALESSQEP